MHRPMRHVLPLAITTRVHPLEPNREVGMFGIGWRAVSSSVHSIGNRDVAVQLHLHLIEIAREIRPFAHRCQTLGAGLYTQGLPAGGPAIAVCETEIAGADAIEKLDVAAN